MGKNKAIILDDDDWYSVEKKILTKHFGAEEAKKLLEEDNEPKSKQKKKVKKENAVEKKSAVNTGKMKIIISRKGFDVANGGMASPIMPDGSLLSFPIPSKDKKTFSDLVFNGKDYKKLIDELKPGTKLHNCHIDPDIRKSAHKKLPSNWEPVFGQFDAAESHLENQGVKENDLFLFFGWFKKAEEVNGAYRYQRGAKDLHVLYGYLQIGKIVQGKDVLQYPWHPHSYVAPSNTMYVASEKLVIDGVDTGLPGAGVFKYSDDLVLTYPGMSKSRWKLPDFFKEVTISCHTKDSFKPEGYFQSVPIGQEFVVSESPKVTEWAKKIIMENVDLEK